MMATIETKYDVGDVVWHATTVSETKTRDCPDCNGERKWSVTSPAGGVYSIACPRCAASFMNDRDLSLKYQAHVPHARRLTIGSVKYDSHGHFSEPEPRKEYMCVETGVGGGSVYREDSLFETEEEALAAAGKLADVVNSETPYIVKAYDRTLEISDYQLDNAALKLAKDQLSRWGGMLWNVNDLFAEIGEAPDKGAIVDLIDDYRRRYMEGDLKEIRAAMQEQPA